MAEAELQRAVRLACKASVWIWDQEQRQEELVSRSRDDRQAHPTLRLGLLTGAC